MNHRKKGNLILKARAKKAHAKLVPKKKSGYICKADRAKMEEEAKAAEEAANADVGQSETNQVTTD